MKKSLLAVAALGAFASAAQAQSSVTVYGLIDEGYASSFQRNVTGAAGAITNQNTSGIKGGNEATNRIGFKGNEDLGGGVSAFFTIESAINTDQGGVFTSGANGTRQAFVGLGKTGLGKISLGTQYTPIHEAAGVTDPGNLNNVNGNVIYDKPGGFGSAAGQVVANSGTTANSISGMGDNTSYTVRVANSVVVKSDTFAGFNVKGILVQGGKDSNAAGGSSTTDNSGWGLGADYTWHKLFVTANYQSFSNQTLGGGTFGQGYGGGNITPGTNAHDNQQYYAATYDFGILKAYLQYVNRKTINEMNGNNYIYRSAQQIGVRAPITPVIQVWASGGTGSINAGGSNLTNSKFNGWQLGSDYFLSKRTNLYAIYGQTATSNNAMATAYGTNTSTGASLNSYNASSYAIGVKHTF